MLWSYGKMEGLLMYHGNTLKNTFVLPCPAYLKEHDSSIVLLYIVVDKL